MKTATMKFRLFSLVALAVGASGVLSLGLARSGEPTDTGVDSPPRAGAHSATISGCLEKLMLTPQQQARIKEIIREYDADLARAWEQFRERYQESIQTEALLLSAIEDNLTEAQRQHVRGQRRKTAARQTELAGTNARPSTETSRPASAVEEELAIVGVALTAEQEAAADKLQEKYLSQLRSLNRDIQGLHMQLVSLEADKLVEIENVLTKEQLVQLREIRQNAPAALTATTSGTGPAKTRTE